MVLKVASIQRDKKSGIHYFRERVPTDLKAKVRGTVIALPVVDSIISVVAGEAVKVSLRTKNASEAKRLHATDRAA